MSKKTTIAVLIAIAGIAISHGASAVPLSPSPGAVADKGIDFVTRVQSKNGAVVRSTGQLRTFRPFQVARVRPAFSPNRVRPGRPLLHRGTVRPQHKQFAHRKRPRRPRHIHVAGGVPPELPPAIYEDNTQDRFPLSPDFCQYWSDRGIITSYLEPCW